MSIDQTTEPLTDPAADQAAQEPTEAPEGTTEAPAADPVRELRDELARRRVRSREQTAAANARLVSAYAASDGRLIEPELLEVSEDLLGEDGLVDPAKVTDAIGALLQAKPYLTRRTPTAPIVQGVQTTVPDSPGLFSLIRDRA